MFFSRNILFAMLVVEYQVLVLNYLYSSTKYIAWKLFYAYHCLRDRLDRSN
jgi:hypothetical protein